MKLLHIFIGFLIAAFLLTIDQSHRVVIKRAQEIERIRAESTLFSTPYTVCDGSLESYAKSHTCVLEYFGRVEEPQVKVELSVRFSNTARNIRDNTVVNWFIVGTTLAVECFYAGMGRVFNFLLEMYIIGYTLALMRSWSGLRLWII